MGAYAGGEGKQHRGGRTVIIVGDSLVELKNVKANSIDAVVTDPPYGLSFMNKKWDYDVPSKDLWLEVFRVLKPGGHVLSFGGTRTYHRLVVAIEDAGFEIRDQIQWIYGSGFPKSHDVSKGIDKASGAERSKKDTTQIDGDRVIAQSIHAVCNICGKRQFSGNPCICPDPSKHAVTAEAKRWQGWGTALKPANEPICVARKPLEKGLTVVANVLKYGTGAINVDGCRIGYSSDEKIDFSKVQDGNIYGANGVYGKAEQKQTTPLFKENGRWPANVIFDEDAAKMLDEPSRFFYIAKASKRERNEGLEGMPKQAPNNEWGLGATEGNPRKPAKCTANEAVQNFHPTVKPIKLMEYLIKLVTPPSGTVLDPFMGSGSTGVACKNLGFNFIGIELNPEYAEIARKRIEHKDKQLDLDLGA